MVTYSDPIVPEPMPVVIGWEEGGSSTLLMNTTLPTDPPEGAMWFHPTGAKGSTYQRSSSPFETPRYLPGWVPLGVQESISQGSDGEMGGLGDHENGWLKHNIGLGGITSDIEHGGYYSWEWDNYWHEGMIFNNSTLSGRFAGDNHLANAHAWHEGTDPDLRSGFTSATRWRPSTSGLTDPDAGSWEIVEPGAILGQKIAAYVRAMPGSLIDDAQIAVLIKSDGYYFGDRVPDYVSQDVLIAANIGGSGYQRTMVTLPEDDMVLPADSIIGVIASPAFLPQGSPPTPYGSLPSPFWSPPWAEWRFNVQSNTGRSEFLAADVRIAFEVQWQPSTFRWVYDAPDTPIPPVRLFPRDDGLGTSSAARLYPAPISEQGSPRRGRGGYW